MSKKTKNGSTILCEVKKLYDFMTKNGLNTLDYNQQDTKVRLVRKSVQTAVPIIAGTQAAVSPQTAPTAPPAQQILGDTLKSPLMGIFYRGPSPSSPPFIKEGETVKEGQVLCLVEAMKVFNEVKADRSCVIEKVLIEDGKPVKAGQPLFVIKKI